MKFSVSREYLKGLCDADLADNIRSTVDHLNKLSEEAFRRELCVIYQIKPPEKNSLSQHHTVNVRVMTEVA